jgi:hypothetical protein
MGCGKREKKRKKIGSRRENIKGEFKKQAFASNISKILVPIC